MPRPRKRRCVASTPDVTFFKPAGIPLRQLEVVVLSVDEAEALRLKEVEGKGQEECAGLMHVSRPTYHRMLQSARKKTAGALIQGKAIRIEGGDFLPAVQSFQCAERGHQWEVAFKDMVNLRDNRCPRCDSAAVTNPRRIRRRRRVSGGKR